MAKEGQTAAELNKIKSEKKLGKSPTQKSQLKNSPKGSPIPIKEKDYDQAELQPIAVKVGSNTLQNSGEGAITIKD